MFLKVSCWSKLMSFFYTCVYRFDNYSYSKHFFPMLVTTDKTRTFVEAPVFFLYQSCALALCTCVPFQDMINMAASYNLHNIFIIVDSSR